MQPLDVVIEMDLIERVRDALTTLTPCEARVLRCRYGIGTDEDHTLEKVGAEAGRNEEIESKARASLRQPRPLQDVADVPIQMKR